MMSRLNQTILAVAFIALLLVAERSTVAQVSLQMASLETHVVGKTVRVGDIASVTTPSRSKADRINNLDVEVFKAGEKEMSVSREQLRIRMMLAGYDINASDIHGPSIVKVRQVSQKDLGRSIEEAVRKQVIEQFGIPESDLQVTLDPKFQNPIGAAAVSNIKISPWNQPDLPLGRQSINASTEVAGKTISFKAPVLIAVIRELAIANQDISAGVKLTEDNVDVVRRPISTRTRSYLTKSQAIGNVANRNIEKYALIQPSRIRVDRGKDGIVIKRNSLINVIAKRGKLTVTLRDVKAVTDGRIGERVQVVNPNTGLRMTARVVDANTAHLF